MTHEVKSKAPAPGIEPFATGSTVPIWLVVLMLALLYLGAVYFDHHGGWFDARIYQPYASAAELELYQPKSGAAAALARGEVVYEQVCGLCHGNDGLGKPNQAPPLAGAEWVNTKGIDRLTRIPLLGLNGPIEVKGQSMTFPAGMVGVGMALSDSDLAAVLTYVRTSWGNHSGPVTADDVKAIRAKLGPRPQPLTGAELKATAE